MDAGERGYVPPVWKRQRKRKRADRGGGGGREAAGEETDVEEEEKRERERDEEEEGGGEWGEEGAKALADGGESLRRVARRSYRTLPRRLSSKSVSSPPALLFLHPPLPSPLPLPAVGRTPT